MKLVKDLEDGKYYRRIIVSRNNNYKEIKISNSFKYAKEENGDLSGYILVAISDPLGENKTNNLIKEIHKAIEAWGSQTEISKLHEGETLWWVTTSTRSRFNKLSIRHIKYESSQTWDSYNCFREKDKAEKFKKELH